MSPEEKLQLIPDWIEAFADCRIADAKGCHNEFLTGLNYWVFSLRMNVGQDAAMRAINYGYPLFSDYIKFYQHVCGE